MFFNSLDFEPIFIYPILSDPTKHWSQNRVSFIFYSDLRSESIINFHHNDCVKCPTIDDLDSTDTLYAFPKIVVPEPSGEAVGVLWDRFASVEMLFWLDTGKRLNLEPDNTIKSYWRMGIENVNDAVPIMRWIDHCRKIRDIAIGSMGTMQQRGFAEYNRFAINLRRIERTGLRSVTN